MVVNCEEVIDYGDEDIVDEPNLFTYVEMMTKPFHFVNGNVLKHSFNPFKRRSGLLNVTAKQGKSSRIMSKNGSLNTMGFTDGKNHKFLKDIFISIISLVRLHSTYF